MVNFFKDEVETYNNIKEIGIMYVNNLNDEKRLGSGKMKKVQKEIIGG